MDQQTNNKRISAIVPAYNEAERIGKVLDVLTTYLHFHEVIVIDDGSQDKTEEVSNKYKVRFLKNKKNLGKGKSMDKAVAEAKGDIIFFADADVIGLTHQIIDEIVKPVQQGEVEMFIGMRNRKIYYLSLIFVFVPLLGGERALTKSLWQKLPDYYKHYFRVEAGLNFYAQYYGQGFKFKVFEGLSQVIKEKKYGLAKGLSQRWKLFYNVISAQLKLQFIEIPKNVKNYRLLITAYLQNLLGALLGFVIIIATYIGPKKFILEIFKKELIEDPKAPLIHWLLKIISHLSIYTILFIGLAILFSNLLFLIINSNKMFRQGVHYNSLSKKIRNAKNSSEK